MATQRRMSRHPLEFAKEAELSSILESPQSVSAELAAAPSDMDLTTARSAVPRRSHCCKASALLGLLLMSVVLPYTTAASTKLWEPRQMVSVPAAATRVPQQQSPKPRANFRLSSLLMVPPGPARVHRVVLERARLAMGAVRDSIATTRRAYAAADAARAKSSCGRKIVLYDDDGSQLVLHGGC